MSGQACRSAPTTPTGAPALRSGRLRERLAKLGEVTEAKRLDDVRLHALPVIMSSREVLQDIGPRLKTITANLEVTSTALRSKSEQVSGLVGDVTTRAQAQAARVDGMVKGTLDQVTYAVHAVEAGIDSCAPRRRKA